MPTPAKEQIVKILAIDPGPVKSALVVWDGERAIGEYLDNEEVTTRFDEFDYYHQHTENIELVIEMIASYGMPVGAEVFETCVWIGQFMSAWGKPSARIKRGEVKMHLCHSMKAKDGNIRQAIIDLFPPDGEGKIPQIGTKSKPGPLYGISGDMWAALAVALTYADKSTRATARQGA
jgi:hypothetical protein